MKRLISQFMLAVFVVLMLSFSAQTVKAAPIIDQVFVPGVFTTYNNFNNTFTVQGAPAAPVVVSYNNGSPNTLLPTPTSFILDTSGLDFNFITPQKVNYTSSTGTGIIRLRQETFPTATDFLFGKLTSLSLEIVNAVTNDFIGSGLFDVLGGSLASDFGNNGGLAQVGLVFSLPANFNNSFFAAASTTLYPNSVPEPATFGLLGIGLCGLIGVSLVLGRKNVHS